MCFPSTLQPGRSVSLRGGSGSQPCPGSGRNRAGREREDGKAAVGHSRVEKYSRRQKTGRKKRGTGKGVSRCVTHIGARFNPTLGRSQVCSSWRGGGATCDVTELKCCCVAPILTQTSDITHTISGRQPVVPQSFLLSFILNVTK